MPFWERPLPGMRHEPNMRQLKTVLQNQLHSTFSSGESTNPITPETLDRASMSQNQKASSYSQPALRVNTKVVQKHAGSEKSSSPRVQHKFSTLVTKQAPPNGDTWTAVSKWLATSQTFEKPPIPVSIADPAPRERHGNEYWLRIAENLDLRMELRSERSRPPIYLKPGSMHAKPGINSGVSNPPSETKLPNPAEHPPPGQLNTTTNTAFPPLPKTMGPANKQERERKTSIEANMSEVQEKLAKHKRERAKQEQEQLEATKSKRADEAVKATAKQFEAAKSKKADEAVKAKAKKLAADAMATHMKEQGRKQYVEGRAQEIHENLLQCKPFDIDAVRREFSEKEVQDIKNLVRGLGFAKKK